MKSILWLSFFFSLSYSSIASTYYFSNSGSDFNNGTSPLTPWQTINQLNSILLLPGDSVLFESGSIFRGEIIASVSGIDTAKIYFGKYGTGELPVISGAELVANWSNYNGNIYQAPLSQPPTQIFADDKRMLIARYPNNGFLYHQSGLGHSGFIDSSLIQSNGFWDGATIRMRTDDRLWEINTVDSFVNFSVNFQTSSFFEIQYGYGYYFDNLLSVLDTMNEWYYDAANQNLYFNAPGNINPNSIKVEASVYDYGIYLEQASSYIMIDSIQFKKQRIAGIATEAASRHISIAHSRFFSQDLYGVSLCGGPQQCSVESCTLSDINGLGISGCNLKQSIIANNILRRIGMIAGYGINGFNQGQGIHFDDGDSIIVQRNFVDSTGNSSINPNGLHCTILQNQFSNALLHFNNNGAFYCYGAGSDSMMLKQNFITVVKGNAEATPTNPLEASGIYLDNNTKNYFLEDNSILNATSFGIFIADGSKNCKITGNVVYNSGEAQLCFQERNIQGNTSGHSVKGNIFYALNENQDIIKLTSFFDNFVPGNFDSNYYFNPYDFYAFHSLTRTDSFTHQRHYTLEQWQDLFLQDENSRSTFFFRNRYTVDLINGAELIQNGDFTNNFDGWSNTTPLKLEMLLDNSTSLDNGCMKMQMLNFSIADTGAVSSHHYSIDTLNTYLLSLSCVGIKNTNVQLVQKRDSGSLIIGINRGVPVTNSRREYGITFRSAKDISAASFFLQMTGEDSVVWLDNISLKEVISHYEIPQKKSRIFVNNFDFPVTFNLGDSIFFDLNQNPVTSLLTVEAFSSVVLIFDSSMITSTENTVFDLNNPFDIYPSPITRGNFLIVKFPRQENDISLALFSIDGKIIKMLREKSTTNSIVNFLIPSSTSAGIYVIRAITQNKIYSKIIAIE